MDWRNFVVVDPRLPAGTAALVPPPRILAVEGRRAGDAYETVYTLEWLHPVVIVNLATEPKP